ncbi:5-hydroxytryptamine receptor 3A-like [Latimeria chalumnae]|uniref:5-hydroxytryptamine receptor 3A-like n=1 Tax=Latimeria chalumnae TaxID=7897 RepID=UPI00313AF730
MKFFLFLCIFLQAGGSIFCKSNDSFLQYEYFRFFERFKDIIGNKFLRPVKNWTTSVQVNISIAIYEIVEVDEKTHVITTYAWVRQIWYNEFIAWDPVEFGGLCEVSLPVDNIWRPDTYVYEYVEEDLAPHIPYLYVKNTGAIRHNKPLRIVSSCNLDIFYFPFDIQICSLSFGPYLHTVKDITMVLHETPEHITEKSKYHIQNKGEWGLINIEAYVTEMKDNGEVWSKAIFKVKIKRRPLLYLVNLVIPSTFLMVIDLLSFYLPIHETDRGTFKMTLLLGYTMFLLIMNDLLPNNAGGTPIIDSEVSEDCKVKEDGSQLSTNLQSLNAIHQFLKKISGDIFMIRHSINSHSEYNQKQGEWIKIAYIWDCLLFRIYLIFLASFSVYVGMIKLRGYEGNGAPLLKKF